MSEKEEEGVILDKEVIVSVKLNYQSKWQSNRHTYEKIEKYIGINR